MRQHRLLSVLWLLAIIAMACTNGCGPEKRAGQSSQVALSGQPSWLPLGGEVYQEKDRLEAEKYVLALRSEPRWFLSYAKAATTQEYEANLQERAARLNASGIQEKSVEERLDGRHYLPTTLPYPRTLDDLPTQDHGVRLALGASATADANVVLLKMTLTSSDGRAVWREVEHRWTNPVPFLFAVYVDGKAIHVPLHAWGQNGGVNYWTKLVDAGGSRDWSLQVDALSIRKLLPDEKPHDVAIVAAFSERQHEAYVDGNDQIQRLSTAPPPNDIPQPQLLLRSNVATLRWTGTTWVAP